MQTAQSAPVRYGPTTGLRRGPEVHRRIEDEEDDESLPRDPRHWSRTHVALWLSKMATQHGLPEIPAARFMMNGKALCLMSVPMFQTRVPVGGKLLYKDFQFRLCDAMYCRQSET